MCSAGASSGRPFGSRPALPSALPPAPHSRCPTLRPLPRSKLTVEHVLPQKPADDSGWHAAFGPEQREHWTHRLGNLVLLHGTLNKKARNVGFAEKKEQWRPHVQHPSHQLPFTDAVARLEQWTPDAAAAHQADMIRAAAICWSLSDVAGGLEGGGAYRRARPGAGALPSIGTPPPAEMYKRAAQLASRRPPSLPPPRPARRPTATWRPARWPRTKACRSVSSITLLWAGTGGRGGGRGSTG